MDEDQVFKALADPSRRRLLPDVTPRYVQADPYEGGKQAVAEAWRNLTAVGSRPIAITDNLNFGNPQRPEIMGQFARAVTGIGDACRALGFPIVSGNVSLYNETNGRGILPTPTIGGVGLIRDWSKMARIGFARAGELGEFPSNLTLLDRCAPIYEDHEGWRGSTAGARSWKELPELARAYLERIEELVMVPIHCVSVGQGRDQILER